MTGALGVEDRENKRCTKVPGCGKKPVEIPLSSESP